MDWVDKPQNYKDLYGILQTLRGSHLNNFPRKFLKLGWVACHSVTFHVAKVKVSRSTHSMDDVIPFLAYCIY